MRAKDDPLHMRAFTAMVLFVLALPLILTVMLSTLLKDYWKRRKAAKL